MEDEYIITLRCKNCENMDCDFRPIGCYYTNKTGCTRRVPEELYVRYIHLIEEVLPFTKISGFSNETYQECMNVFEKIYNCKGQKLNHIGKIPY